MSDAKYPKYHEAGTRVPKGGSCCQNCKWVRGKDTCTNKYYQEWSGADKIPAPLDEYCSDWWESQDSSTTADDIHEAFARTLARIKP